MRLSPEEWPQLSRLLDALLDTPPAEREAWIAGLRGADAVHAGRLRALLAADADRGARLGTLPRLAGLEDGIDVLPDTGDRAGDEFGPYRLLRPLGRGGMATVWYAQRSDGLLSRGVALKLPLSREPLIAARFAREQEIVSALVHPHIARLYDVGVTREGRAYFALEYVDGVPLDEFCDRERMPLRERVRLFRQVLDAVQYAHSRLVIHRDLKPSNILVTPERQAMLVDFGIAKVLTSAGNDAELTRTNVGSMTLAYASPEQVAGVAITTATDLYSLGVVLYELLVGARPHRPSRPGRGALEAAILEADARSPSAVAIDRDRALARGAEPRTLARELRGDLDAIVLRVLEREPERRYATASAFAEDLDRYLGGRAVRAHRPSRLYRWRKFAWRNRLAVGGVALATVALLLASAVALRQSHVAALAARAAAAERDEAVASAAHRQAVDDFMYDLLLEADRTGTPLSVASLVERADQLSEREFEGNPDARAAVLRTVGDFEAGLGGWGAALDHYQRAHALLAGTADSRLSSSVRCSIALIQGYSTANASVATLRSILADPRTPRDSALECQYDLAQLLIFAQDAAAAAQAANAALDLWQAGAMHTPAVRLDLLRCLAETDAMQGRRAEAEAKFVAIMAELRALGRERGIAAKRVRDLRIENATASGDLARALAEADEQAAIDRADIPDRPAQSLTVYKRSELLAGLGRLDEALAGFAAVEGREPAEGPTLASMARLSAAMVLARLGRLPDAERRYQRAVSAWQREPPLPVVQLTATLTRAWLDLAGGQYALAQQRYDAALQGARLGPMTRAGILWRRALAELGERHLEAARLDAGGAIDAYRAMQGDSPHSLWVGEAELALARVESASGDVRGARRSAAQAAEELRFAVGAGNPDLALARALASAGTFDRPVTTQSATASAL
jgi:serine/threonine-protein kinase